MSKGAILLEKQLEHSGFRELFFIIAGAPRTKKNHGIIATKGRPRMLPSPQFTAWNRIAQLEIARFRAWARCPLPLDRPVNVCAAFYRDRDTGDAVGYYQALADALEEGGVLTNDRLIVSWDGSRLLKDAAHPRIEVKLEIL